MRRQGNSVGQSKYRYQDSYDDKCCNKTQRALSNENERSAATRGVGSGGYCRCEICALRVPSITFEQSSKPSFTISYNKNIVYFITVIRWLECVCPCQLSRLKASSNIACQCRLVLTTNIGT